MLRLKQTPSCLLYLSRFGQRLKQKNGLLVSAAKSSYCASHPQQLITKNPNVDQWKMGFSGLSKYLYSSRFGYLGGLRTRNCLIADVGRRYYCVDRNQVYHFKERSFDLWNHALVAAGWLLGLGAITYLSNQETTPYSNRTRLILCPRKFEKMIGELQFKVFKEKNRDKVLPSTHPSCVRVRLIAENVIKAAQRGLRDDPGYLGHVNWEVIVVDEPNSPYVACCFLGGKIVVYTCLLWRMFSDAEMATVIAHEVAHAVARHCAESFTDTMTLGILELLTHNFGGIPVVEDLSAVFRELPNSRKMELEADYIGVLLMAMAGYDPRAALRVRRRCKKDDDPRWEKYLDTHPSGKKRFRMVAEAQEEALELYKESLSSRASV